MKSMVISKLIYTKPPICRTPKIGRSQLCCDIEKEGAKMIDIKYHVLALQFKGVVRLFDNNYSLHLLGKRLKTCA